MLIKKNVVLIFSAISILLIPFAVSAQGDFGNVALMLLAFKNLLKILTIVIIALALVFFIWGLAVFILNAGNEDKRTEGKQKMFWGVIAFVVMIGIWGIVTFLLSAFGLNQNAPPFIPGIEGF